jgi:hypothetical protein
MRWVFLSPKLIESVADSDGIGGTLACGNVAVADPATGVASAASDEMSTAIAPLLSRCENAE